MANIKKWATGKIGNTYPDHADRGNPNSKGLDSDGLPGIEAYIEEDPVLASNDNRPIKNLVENDGILSQNITDVSSEVDNGIFKGKYDQFDLTIQPQDYHTDPETGDTILINTLRVGAGSAIVNGQVTRLGNQKLVYFYRSDDANSILFPTYDESSDSFQVEIYDDDYFKDRTTRTFGSYVPVYNTLTDDLPSSFEDYEVIIINRDTQNSANKKITVFDMYRDWEDITPFKARSETATDEAVSFNSDLNFGQSSDGYWLNCGGVENTRVSDVKIEKDITVKNKALNGSDFTQSGSEYVKSIVTDGLFFKDLKWGTNEFFNPYYDIQDLYVDSDEVIYFIQRSSQNKRLFKLGVNSTQLETKDIGTPDEAVNLIIRKIGNYLAVAGTKGVGVNGFIALYDTTQTFADGTVTNLSHFSGTEDIHDIFIWDGKVWIAGSTKLWYTDENTFDPLSSTFTEINLDSFVKNTSNGSIINHITKLQSITGNYVVSSSLNTDIVNLADNSSFEDGGIGNIPNNWTLEENASGSQFKISDNAKKYGNYCAMLKKSATSSYASVVQSAEAVNGATVYTLALDLKSNIATTDVVKLTIYELATDGSTLGSSTSTITPTTDWTRYSLSHTVVNSSAASFKYEIRSEVVANTTECAYLDGVQFETGSAANEYVETFNYMVIGFKKISTDELNPPLAIIDRNDPYHVKYVQGKYGNIMSVNDITSVGHNKLMFVDDHNVYTLTLLNNRNEYDRFTAIPMLDRNNDSYNNIKRFETIRKIGDKVFYGGIVDNRVIKIESVQTKDQTITITDAGVGNGESFLTLIGGYTSIAYSESRNASIQFNRIAPCYDTTDNLTGPGAYIPSAIYSFKVIFNDDTDNAKIIQITAPAANEAPWTIDQIKNKLAQTTLPTGLQWVATDVAEGDLAYPEWYKVSSSVTVKDGFYSFNGKDQETHIRGNIHSIFVKSDSSFYIAKDGQIFKSKVDPNLLKIGSTGNSSALLMKSSGYVHYDWDLHDTDYSLDDYNTVTNKEIVFADDTSNQSWIDLAIGDGYKLLPGSLRVKTSPTSEVGYSEDIDYFVDYENAKIIRSKNKNFVSNPSFSLMNGSDISGWSFYSDITNSKAYQHAVGSSFTDYAAKMYKNSSATKAALYQKISATELLGVSKLQVGQTYTFSVYLQSNAVQNSMIRITECTDALADDFHDSNFTGKISGNSYNITEKNKWTRFTVSHTVASVDSTMLRIEVYSNSSSQMLVAKPMLQNNPIATPYIEGQRLSQIDPDSHVWIDFQRIKTLTPTTDYVFDTEGRSVNLKFAPDVNSTYYLTYKYTKIFNPYKFGDAKPNTSVIDYTDNDDYFLFELEGKIWAINQNFALLSLDSDNPLKISYKYYYPRIDQLKIRNSPDKYGNYLYLVQGTYDANNPYRPVDVGITKDRYVYNTKLENIDDITDLEQFDNTNNDILYEINVTANDYTKNDIYDRRIYVDAKSHKLFNISLYPETIAYFPFIKDFNSTNGLVPLNNLKSSKIVPIIKNYLIVQNAEVGAYHDSYQYVLRNNSEMIFPATSFSVFVDPIYGSDTNTGDSSGDALRSIKKALTLLTETRCNIIITRNGIISENVEIDKTFPVKIFASTYCYWQGGLQNLSELSLQGIWFQNTNIYCYEKLNIFYCTFENSVINCVYPQTVNTYNCEFSNCHNSVIRVKDTIFPSPFTHPYQKFPLRDDGVVANPDSIATSSNESIAPGDSFYDSSLASQPQGTFNFTRCLFHDATDTLFQYDPNPDWISKFYFSYCTIAHNLAVFATEKANLNIEFENTIFFKNRQTVGSKEIIFDSNSDILFYNCFIDFSATAPVSDYNLGSGTLLNRDSCLGKEDNADPGFLGLILGTYDYHLKSVAKGSSFDSVCLDKGVSGDIGVYDESREQQDKGLPKKLRTYVAYLGEGIVYPVRLNSEKITITMEFKPTGSISQSGIVFDTRSSADDEDYIVLAYNNNAASDHSLTQNPTNAITNPYRFRVIVANKEKSYSVVSPIEIYTDEEFQNWHKISFTVNYEEILNPKSTFVEKDKKQNIITLYHNDTVTIESFIKYDLNRFVDGELITGRGGENTNAWDFNNISQFITLGSDYNNSNKMIGYYTELRLDNRFIDRKQFEMWNEKVVPFNDPLSYVNQTPLARTVDAKILNDFWSLKSKSDVGAKGNKFVDGSKKRFFYDNGDIVWALTESVNNLYTKGAFTSITNASAIADSIIDWTNPIVIRNTITLKTTKSRLASDNTGFDLDIKNPLMSGYYINPGYQEWSKSGGIASGTATTIPAGTYKFKIAINGGAVVEKSITLAANATWGTILSALQATTSGTANWAITSFATLRCTSATTSFAGTIAISAGSSSDLLAQFTAQGATLGASVAPASQITLRSKAELQEAIAWGFSQLETLLSFSFTKEGKLRFFTKDWGVPSTELVDNTVQITVTLNSSDNAALGFSSTSKSGVRAIDPYNILGLTSTNAAPNGDVDNGNHIWTAYDADYDNFGNNALFVKKNSSTLEEDIIKVYQTFNLGTGYYTYSTYIYSESAINNDTVSIYYNGNVEDFDDISRYYGNWWLLSKTMNVTSAGSNVPVGTVFMGKGDYVVGGMQFENKFYVSPFSENYDTTTGKLIVPKNAVTVQSGVIAFKFKPLFNFYETDEKYILEALGYDNGNMSVDLGYRITYHYDTKKKRGIVKYSINSTNSKWELEIVEKFFYQWHTCIINYDFNINRFVYWFDYYSNIVDEALTVHELSDLYIGHGVVGATGDRVQADRPANIMVKDIITTNYPITDTETQNWVNTNEFFNESLIVNTIDEYKNQVEEYVGTANNLVSVTNDLVGQVQTLSASVGSIEGEYSAVTNKYTTLDTSINTLSNRVSVVESKATTLDNQLNVGSNSITAVLNYMQDNNTGLWSPSVSGANLYKLREDVNTVGTNITTEVNQRTTGDLAIRNDFASTSTNASGARLVGIESTTASPSTAQFTATTVEAALRELAGNGRTTESVRGLQLEIEALQSSSTAEVTTLSLMKDGSTGTWTPANAQNNGWNIASLRADINSHASTISTIQQSITTLNSTLGTEVGRLDSRIDTVYSTLASTEENKGSSLVGFYNGTLFEATTVEAAIKELAGTGRNSSMTVAGNYNAIQQHTLEITGIQTGYNTVISDVASNTTEINKMKDGSTGATWTNPDWNLAKHEDRLDTIDISVTEFSTTLDGHTLAIDGLVSRVTTAEQGLASEITTRQNADNLFKSNDANKGASLIGISDVGENFTATQVEGALAELASKVNALAGSLAWRDAVATYDDLPIADNKVGDARTVKADVDGHQSQYVCVQVTGTRAEQWIKIADIDWGNASAINYSNTNSGLASTNVNDAIDEVFQRTKDLTKFEKVVAPAGWTTETEGYSLTVQHNLGTTNVVTMLIDTDTGLAVEADEIIRVDSNTIKILATRAFNVMVTVFSVIDRFSTIVNAWTPEGNGHYYTEINHGFGTKAIMVSVFDIVNGTRVGVDNIEFATDDTVRIHVTDSSAMLNVYITKSGQNAIVKDVKAWTLSGGSYVSMCPSAFGYDAAYSFFDATSGKTVEIDNVKIENGILKLTKSTSDPIRMVIIQ